MESNPSSITIHMVCSLDGFIAKKDGDVSWMASKDNYPDGVELTEEIIQSFLDKIDCYVMGSATYEQALKLGWPYADKPVIVATNRTLSSEKKSVLFYTGHIKDLAKEVKTKYTNVWMVGGAKLAKEFINLNLADEIVITFLPIILGDGIPFFESIEKEHHLHLKDAVAYKDGMVEVTYEMLH